MANSKIPNITLADTLNTQRLRINQLLDSVGDVSTLTTTAGPVTDAINELDAELGTITSGAMGTTASTVSTAINELDGRLDSINDTELLSPRIDLTDGAATNTIAGKLEVGDSADFASNVSVDGNLKVGGNTTMAGTLTVDGQVTFKAGSDNNIALGDATTDTITLTGEVNSNIIPDSDNQYDLGSETKEWRHVYVDGTVNADNVAADSATVTGNLDVQGYTTLDSATVDGDLTVTNDLDVQGLTTLDSSTVDGDLDVTGNLDVTGTVTSTGKAFGIAAESGTADDITLGDTITFAAGVGIDTTVSNNQIEIAGEDASSSNKGVASFDDGDFVVTSGDVTLADSTTGAVLAISGTANEVNVSRTKGTVTVGLPDNVTIDSDLTVTGHATIGVNNTPDVTNINHALVVDSDLTVSGSASVTGTLDVNGATTLDSATVDGPLNVTGVTTLDSATVDGPLNVTGNLDVGGITNLDSTNIVGFVDITGGLSVSDGFTVGGTFTTTGTQRGEASFIVVNDGVVVANGNRAGLKVDRPSTDSAVIQWNEAGDYWEAGTSAGVKQLALQFDSAQFTTLDVSGTATIENLTVKGTTTYLNTETVEVADNILELNSNATGVPLSNQDAGIEVERGTRTNVQLLWDESAKYWVAATDSTNTLSRIATANWIDATSPIVYSSTSGNISHANSGVSAGSYNSVTVDAKGHVTGGSNTTYDNYVSWTAEDGDGSTYPVTSGDTLKFADSDEIQVDFTADDVLMISHKDVTRTNTTNTAAPGYGGTFTAIDGITTNARGHVTGVNTKTVTIPASDNTNTNQLTVWYIEDSDGTEKTMDHNKELKILGDNDYISTNFGSGTGTNASPYDLKISHTLAGGGSSSGTETLASQGTFDAVTGLSYDAAGHVDSIRTMTFTLPASSDTLQSISNNTSNSNQYVTFVASASGTQTGRSSANLLYNPSTRQLDLSSGGKIVVNNILNDNGSQLLSNTTGEWTFEDLTTPSASTQPVTINLRNTEVNGDTNTSIAKIDFRMDNDAGTDHLYSRIEGRSSDFVGANADGSENGRIELHVMSNGTLTESQPYLVVDGILPTELNSYANGVQFHSYSNWYRFRPARTGYLNNNPITLQIQNNSYSGAQVTNGDSIGEIHFEGPTNTSTFYDYAKIRTSVLDKVDRFGKFSIETSNNGVLKPVFVSDSDLTLSVGGTGDMYFKSDGRGSYPGFSFSAESVANTHRPVQINMINTDTNLIDGQELGSINFQGKNSASQDQVYALVYGGTSDITDGTEDGYIALEVRSGGVSNLIAFSADGEGDTTIRSANDITLDAPGNISLDADGGTVAFKDGALSFLNIVRTNLDDVTFDAPGDITFDVTDGIIDLYHNGNQDIRLDFATTDTLKLYTGTTTLNSTWAGSSLTVQGNITSVSDVRTKENIETITDGLEIVDSLRGVRYNKIGKEDREVGVIAQEVEEVLPEVVLTDTEGMKSVDYGKMVGVLIEAIKELKQEIEELKGN